MPRPSGGHGLTATHAAVARTNTAPHACCCNAHQSCQLSCDASPKLGTSMLGGECAREHKQPISQSVQAASVTHTKRRTPVERVATDCSAATEAVLHCPWQGPSTGRSFNASHIGLGAQSSARPAACADFISSLTLPWNRWLRRRTQCTAFTSAAVARCARTSPTRPAACTVWNVSESATFTHYLAGGTLGQ